MRATDRTFPKRFNILNLDFQIWVPQSEVNFKSGWKSILSGGDTAASHPTALLSSCDRSIGSA